MNGCKSIVREVEKDTENIDHLIISAVPIFPSPHPDIVKELEEVCPKDKCFHLYEWFGKLKILDEQLQVYEEMIKH